MAAAKHRLKINQGETFTKVIHWRLRWPSGSQAATNVDLTGCTARMHMREVLESSAVLLELSTANGRALVDGPAGTITLKLSAAETAAIAWDRAVYDLEITFANGEVRRLMQGAVVVSREVTRAS